jgi:hypothetical protein
MMSMLLLDCLSIKREKECEKSINSILKQSKRRNFLEREEIVLNVIKRGRNKAKLNKMRLSDKNKTIALTKVPNGMSESVSLENVEFYSDKNKVQ